MEPKYLAGEVIVHPNHPVTRWLDPYLEVQDTVGNWLYVGL